MMPPGYQINAGYQRLQRDWAARTLAGGAPVPPSLELYVEAVRRANSHGEFVSAVDVAASLVAGRWPTDRDERAAG